MELIIRDNPMPSPGGRSRSPSLGAISMPIPGRTNRRKITIIDGDFQDSQTELNRSQTPPPFDPSSPHRLSSSGSYTERPRQRCMTSPPSDFRNSRGSTSLNNLDRIHVRPSSPSLSWRSSNSSLADTSMTSLIHPPSSEQRILKDIKKQMTASFVHTKQLERQVTQIPKLRNDLQALYKEREKLLNELLEHRAIVLQLKQRVSLLHEQNQELAKLAKSDKSSNTQVLAIRNTLVTTMAQLKQMEDQVQTIPSLRAKIRELEEQIASNKGQLTPSVPSDLPEGVTPDEYLKIIEENTKLKDANSHLMSEMKVVSKHLAAVSESCEGLQKRMEMFQSSQNNTGPLNERIKALEEEKSSLYQELVDARYPQGAPATANGPVNLDVAHYKKEARSLKKANSRLRSKIEHMKMESRAQKEQLVLKLFEIESLNVKTSKYEIEKQLLELEQVQVISEGAYPSSPSAASAGAGDDSLREISPDGRALILRFQQLEVHSQEMQNVIKTFVSERQEMEARIVELTAQLNQTGVEELQQQLEESDSKLVIAREKIRSLEETLARRSLSPEQNAVENERDTYREQVNEMKSELRRLSAIERQAVYAGSQTDELLETRAKLEKTKGEKERANRKFKESRNRLKTLASELASSAELVKRYQEQCSEMGLQLEQSTKEMENLRGELAKTKASLELREIDLKNSELEQTDDGSNEIDEYKSRIESLSNELSHLGREKDDSLKERDEKITSLQSELNELRELERATQNSNAQLETKLKQSQSSLEQANTYKTELEKMTKISSEKTKLLNETEFQLNELKGAHEILVKEKDEFSTRNKQLADQISTLVSNNNSLQQKVTLLTEQAPSLVQQSTELRVERDETLRKLQKLQSDIELLSKQSKEWKEKFESSEITCKEFKKKLRLLQSDLDQAESCVDESKIIEEKLRLENSTLKEGKEKIELKIAEKDKELTNMRTNLRKETQKLQLSEEKCKSLLRDLTNEKESCENIRKELNDARNNEIPKLHSEIAKTVSEIGQLTSDYSSRLSQIRELENTHQQIESEKIELLKRVEFLEKEKGVVESKFTSLRTEHSTKCDELKTLQVNYSKTADELRKIKDELRKLQTAHSKKKIESTSMKAEANKYREEVKTSQSQNTKMELQLKEREQEISLLKVQVQELEKLRVSCKERETQCEMLTATRDNLLRRLDKMEKLEMDYELLKHHVQEMLGQSSQLKDDNKVLLEILQGVQSEMPALEKEATRNLQEENLELQQQVSLLSQWNDKHQQTITSQEQQLESLEREKRKLLNELQQIETLKQANTNLKRELGEVEIEANRLRRQVQSEHQSEIQEEMKVKLETQSQLISIFNEHNKGLQLQVAKLHKQVRHLGGHLDRDRPISPPPMPELSNTLQYVSLDARRCSELELQNASLQQQLGRLQAELIAAQDISPIIRRRSSTLLAVSSVSPIPPLSGACEECPLSVPEDMLLSCSMLADGFSSNREIPQEQSKSYLMSIGQGWFALVTHKNLTGEALKSYLTTFSRLSSKLLAIIINMQDNRGNSALHHALANSNYPAVSLLIEIDTCNTNITNKAGYTPLMLAAAHNVDISPSHKPVLQKLMARTDVKIRSKVELQTALMLAVSSGSVDLVSMLLESGSNINERDKDGSTSLMFACEKGYTSIVQKLISNPACDVTLKDEDGQTALQIAQTSGHSEIVTLIKNHLKTNRKR